MIFWQVWFLVMISLTRFVIAQNSPGGTIDSSTQGMLDAVADIGAKMQALEQDIQTTRDGVASVFDYFGEDPKRNPTDFFATLTSFCAVRLLCINFKCFCS